MMLKLESMLITVHYFSKTKICGINQAEDWVTWPNLLHRHTSKFVSFWEWSVASMRPRIWGQPRNLCLPQRWDSSPTTEACNNPPGHTFESPSVTVKTLGLLLDRAWIWLGIPGFKHDYLKEVYQSDVCFVGCGLRTGDFHGDCSEGDEKWSNSAVSAACKQPTQLLPRDA